jgi:PAS domain S-box-containing protein
MITKQLIKVLLVEDSESDAALLRESIRMSNGADFDIGIAGSIGQAIEYFQKNHVDVTLLDLTLPDSYGLETIKRIKQAGSEIPIVVLTGVDDENTGVEAVRMGAQDYLVKGRADGMLITRAIRYAIERKRTEDALKWSARRNEVLSETASRLLRSDNPQEIVDDLCRHVMEFLNCDMFFNFLVDEQAGRLRMNACAGIPEAEASKIRWLDYGVAVCGCVARDRVRIIAEDIMNTPDPRTELVKSFGIQAYCCHPLIIRERLIGTLSFGTRSRPHFGSDEIDVMKTIADLVAIAIDRLDNQTILQKSREDLTRAQEVGNIGSWRLDVQKNILIWSRQNHHIFGIPEGTPMNYATFLSTIHPDDRKYVYERWLAALNGENYDIEHRIIVDGKIKWVREKAYLEFDIDKKLLGGFGITQDITERKLNEEHIKNIARFPMENPYPVLRINNDGIILFSNAPGELLLKDWNCQVNQKAPDEWQSIVSQSLRYQRRIEKRVESDGKIFSCIIAPVVDGQYANLYGRDITIQEQIKGILRRSRDELNVKVKQRTAELAQTVDTLREEIQERVFAEKKLKVRTRDMDAFFSNTITPLVILDKNFNYIRVNNAYAQSCQRGINEFEGQNYFEFFPNKENQRIFEKVVINKIPYQATAKPFTFPGHPEWGVSYWDWTLVPVLDDDGEVEILIFSLKDVTRRRHAEEIVKAERQRFNDVLETLPAYVCLMTPDYRMPFANRVFRESFGYDPEKKCHEFLFNRGQPCELCETFSVFKTNKPAHWEWTGPNSRNYDIYDFPFTDTDGSHLIMEMGIDVTELKQAQKRSQITNKLLEQFAKKASRKEYLDSVVEIIRDYSGCRCVGLRLTDADNYIPYKSYIGFSEEFISQESNLCLNEDACACIRVISQTSESQDKDVMTSRGSFYCNGGLSFVNSLSVKKRKRFCGTCMKAGFNSIAVIPIRYRQSILGAIHIADEGRSKISQDAVKFLEDMASLIGEAVHRFDVEDSLRTSQNRLVEAQRLVHLGNWELDTINNRLFWSDEIYRIFGRDSKLFTVTYDDFLSYVHPDDRKLVEETFQNVLLQGHAFDIEHRIIKSDGSEKVVQQRAKVSYDENHKPIKITGTVYDITKQKKAEDEIRWNQKELRALTTELQLTEERERRQIAQDLHDSIGQILAFSGRELKNLLKSLPEQTAAPVQAVINQLEIAIKEARTLSFDLSPSILYDLGFEVAIEDLVDRISKERQIKGYFNNSRELKPLDDNVKVLLYRAVRELLINAAKHANASLVKVSLLRSSTDIYVKVEDNGQGFDTYILKNESKKARGFGIFSIHERLNHIGGQLKIESVKGKGTKAILIAPLASNKNGGKGV